MESGTGHILGHAQTIARLWAAMGRDALHHAYLFEGPRGVGKRAVADLLAKAANCTDPAWPEGAPCGRCPSCAQIAAGTHPDVLALEPDRTRAGGLIRVEQVREIVRKTGYHRYGSRRRTIVIDPAEAMQDAAANALLKTLEEPPDGTGFVVVCTNASALLPTIVSRCLRVRFGAVEERAIAAWLEHRELENADACARLAHGCPGRALELAHEGLARRTELRAAWLAVLGGTLKEGYNWSAKLCDGQRQEWTKRVEALLEVAEDLLRDATVRGSSSELPLLNADMPEVVDAWAAALWPTGIEACRTAIEEARDNLQVYVSGKTVVDAVVARFRLELAEATAAR